jgi:hypothetical protein
MVKHWHQKKDLMIKTERANPDYNYSYLSNIGFNETQIEKYASLEKKWDKSNPNTTELERILDGRDEKYWKIADRFKALDNYFNSNSSKQDINRLKKEGKYEEVIQMLESLKKKKRILKISEEYRNSTISKIEGYLNNVNKQKEVYSKRERTKSQSKYGDNQYYTKIDSIEERINNFFAPVDKIFSKLTRSIGKTISKIEEYVYYKPINQTPQSTQPVLIQEKAKPKNIILLSEERENRKKKQSFSKRIAAAMAFASTFLIAPYTPVPEKEAINMPEIRYLLPEENKQDKIRNIRKDDLIPSIITDYSNLDDLFF